jgi:hypothetical protein
MAEQDHTQENEVVQAQYKRTLENIIIGNEAGPEITVGDITLRFKKSAPVSALAALLANENRVEGMTQYLSKTLVPGQEELFTQLLDVIDIAGLAAVLDALGEGYTSFPDQS